MGCLQDAAGRVVAVACVASQAGQGLLPRSGAGVLGAEGLADLAAGLAPRAGEPAYRVVAN